MALCDNLISMGIQRNCAERSVAGLEPNAVLVNYEDVDFDAVTWAENSSNIVEDLPLKPGKIGYNIYQEGSQPFSGSTVTITAPTATLAGSVSQTVNIRVLETNPAVCEKLIDKIINGGRFVMVVENKAKGLKDASTPGASAFEVIGLDNGLMLAEGGTRDRYSEETNGGWLIPLTVSGERRSATFLYAGTYADTKTLFDSLTTAE